MQRNRDITIGVILLAFSSVVFAMARQLPREWDGGGLSPSSFPSALAGFIGFLSIILIITGITSKDREKLGSFFGVFFWQMVVFFAVMAVYIVIMPLIGYVTSTIIFVIATYLLLVGKISASFSLWCRQYLSMRCSDWFSKFRSSKGLLILRSGASSRRSREATNGEFTRST